MNKTDLTGKVAVVVEGGKGLGRIISKALVEQGAIVHILTKDLKEAEKVIEEELFIESPSDERIYRAVASLCSTDNISSLKLFHSLVEYRHGRIDFFINPEDCSSVH